MAHFYTRNASPEHTGLQCNGCHPSMMDPGSGIDPLLDWLFCDFLPIEGRREFHGFNNGGTSPRYALDYVLAWLKYGLGLRNCPTWDSWVNTVMEFANAVMEYRVHGPIFFDYEKEEAEYEGRAGRLRYYMGTQIETVRNFEQRDEADVLEDPLGSFLSHGLVIIQLDDVPLMSEAPSYQSPHPALDRRLYENLKAEILLNK